MSYLQVLELRIERTRDAFSRFVKTDGRFPFSAEAELNWTQNDMRKLLYLPPDRVDYFHWLLDDFVEHYRVEEYKTSPDGAWVYPKRSNCPGTERSGEKLWSVTRKAYVTV